MKTLLVLRHAKSSKDDPSLRDHDRPLNERGVRDAPRVGTMLKDHELVPDEILSSPALRAKETARLAALGCEFKKEIRLVADFYPGEPEDYLKILKTLPDEVNRVMVVGHNPGIEELIWMLIGTPEEIPTAALTTLELPINTWAELTSKVRAKLISIWRPKENP
jgi:phosphohistidine phosphatase